MSAEVREINPDNHEEWLQICKHPNGTHWCIIIPNHWLAVDVSNYLRANVWPKKKPKILG